MLCMEVVAPGSMPPRLMVCCDACPFVVVVASMRDATTAPVVMRRLYLRRVKGASMKQPRCASRRASFCLLGNTDAKLASKVIS